MEDIVYDVFCADQQNIKHFLIIMQTIMEEVKDSEAEKPSVRPDVDVLLIVIQINISQ